MTNLKENIKGLIRQCNTTQDVVAAKLGIKQGTLSQKIGQDSKIKYQTLSDIADILGVSVIDIITFPDIYVLETTNKHCDNCKEKDRAIKNLNDYIDLLTKKLNL